MVSDHDELSALRDERLALLCVLLLLAPLIEVGSGGDGGTDSNQAVASVGCRGCLLELGGEHDFFDSLLNVLVDEVLNAVVSIFNALLNVVPAILNGSVKLGLEFSDERVDILLDLLSVSLIFRTEIDNSVVQDALNVVRGLLHLLLSLLGTSDFLLLVEGLPFIAGRSEPIIDGLLIIAPADESILDLDTKSLEGIHDRFLRRLD